MKDHIVVVLCKWTQSAYVYPKLLTEQDAERVAAKLTDFNNTANIKRLAQ